MENCEERIRDYYLSIKVESQPNKNCRTFHCRQKLLGYGKYANHISGIDETRKLPILIQAVISSLRETTGIKRVSCWPYEVDIEKAVTCTWEELDVKNKNIFATYLPI